MAKSKQLLFSFIEDDQIYDTNVMKSLKSMDLVTQAADIETVYLTLLACYVLEEAYSNERNHWKLIVVKA